ncbi:hypothetical protein PsYK624_040910 [Phanerochaete sordida]|uniref:DUF6533 domain-containing protein n=1 Tax=Phanerochaete sordida TaxID=48140 RepID=A0A9P3G2T8_9APHY|nr:hypothetical protein PsYK624_040910 [Phanerochaete sordida]
MDTPSTALKPQFFLHTSLSLSATVILLYDHIITFDNECRRIWTRPWCKASAIFLLTRYVAFFVIPVMLYTDFPEMSAPTVSPRSQPSASEPQALCTDHFKLYRQIAIGIMQLIVAANQFLRVYALYGRDRRVAAAVALVAGTVGAISVWSITVRETSDAEANCHLILSGETTKCEPYVWASYSLFYPAKSHPLHEGMAIVWVAYFAYDLLIFALMLTKAARDRAQLAQAERGSLITIVYRDGAMYFA